MPEPLFDTWRDRAFVALVQSYELKWSSHFPIDDLVAVAHIAQLSDIAEMDDVVLDVQQPMTVRIL